MRISIHQPYFASYEAHYRLLSEVDLHVVLDDVQMIRRGYVHRNKLLDANNTPQWFTLPLQYALQDTAIKDIRFADDALEKMRWQARRFKALSNLPASVNRALWNVRHRLDDYLVDLLAACALQLGRCAAMTRSSSLWLASTLRGQEKLIAICKHYGATHYLNAPGGRGLYDVEEFRRHGIELEFLEPWTGRMESVLQILSEKQTTTKGAAA